MSSEPSAGVVPGRRLERGLTSAERLGLAAVLALILHGAVLLFLVFAAEGPWPEPRSYLGSVTVELDVAPPAPEPAAVRPAPRPDIPQPAPSPRPSQQPQPATQPRVAQQAQVPRQAPVPQAPAAVAPSRALPAASESRSAAAPLAAPAGGAPAAAPVTSGPPSAGAARAPAYVAPAAPSPQASDTAAPLVESEFRLPARRTETSQPSTERVEQTPLARGSAGAVGGIVGATGGAAGAAPGSTSGGSLMDQIGNVRAGPGVATGPVDSGAVSSGGVAAGLPLADPGGLYEIRGENLGKRGLLRYVEPDLAGLDPWSSTITVEVRFYVAASGLVMDPKVVRGAPNPQTDVRILAAVRRWLFTPEASASMVDAAVTFTIVPRS